MGHWLYLLAELEISIGLFGDTYSELKGYITELRTKVSSCKVTLFSADRRPHSKSFFPLEGELPIRSILVWFFCDFVYLYLIVPAH